MTYHGPLGFAGWSFCWPVLLLAALWGGDADAGPIPVLNKSSDAVKVRAGWSRQNKG